MNRLTETVVPAWIAIALGAATIGMLAGVVLLMLRSKRATATQNPTIRDQKVLRRLFIAALVPTLVVIAAVMGISFIGLSSFARHDMGWHSWVSLIVPLSLDGISITFGFWAFVAVKRGRHPGRSEKIVYVGALISAWINYNHGRQEWTGAAGVYLGFLSLASAWMFHELLSQFMDAQEARPRARRNGIPMFGERWLWAPWSTLMARRAWVVYPPNLDVEPTPTNALINWQQVRELRAAKRTRHRSVATSSAQPVSTTASRHTESEPAVTHRDDIPATPIDVPDHLISTARFAVTNHEQVHGRTISPDELSAAINIPPAVAGQLLATLAERTAPVTVAPVLNGTPIGGDR